MEFFLTMIVFCIVLFFYIHVHFHVKTSNDLEVYDVIKPSKEKLEELCDLRQPITMNFNNKQIKEKFTQTKISRMYGAFDVNIRNTEEKNTENEKYVPLAFNTVLELFNAKDNKKYFSENNSLFLNETSLEKTLMNNDLFLRPYMVSSCNYDLIMGSYNTFTPLKYDMSYRHYFYITEGRVQIKLAPPKSTRYMYRENDYEMFEFRSPINPWNVDKEHESNFNKIKFLEISLEPGMLIFIPSYWWYSIKFMEKSSVVSFKYITYMNTISMTPQLLIHYLQTLNVKFNTENKVNIEDSIADNITTDNKTTDNITRDNTLAESTE